MDKPKKYEDLLMAALNFTEADLEANQAGELSARQIAALEKRRGLMFMGVFVSMVVMALFFLIASVMQPSDDATVFYFFTVFPALFTLYLAYNVYRYGKDIHDRRSAVVEGRVELDISGGQNSANFAIKLENKKFRLNKRQFLTFKSGDPYRVYYAPKSRRILSAEWLRDDSPFVDQSTAHERLIDADVEQTVGRDSQRIIAEDDEIAPLSRRDASP